MGECREKPGHSAACRFLLPFFPKAKPDIFNGRSSGLFNSCAFPWVFDFE
jgi:hypothetical protein